MWNDHRAGTGGSRAQPRAGGRARFPRLSLRRAAAGRQGDGGAGVRAGAELPRRRPALPSLPPVPSDRGGEAPRRRGHRHRRALRGGGPEHKDHSADGSKEIRICQVRRLKRIASRAPFEGRYRVAIIDPADALNAESSNALLKTLEEPVALAGAHPRDEPRRGAPADRPLPLPPGALQHDARGGGGEGAGGDVGGPAGGRDAARPAERRTAGLGGDRLGGRDGPAGARGDAGRRLPPHAPPAATSASPTPPGWPRASTATARTSWPCWSCGGSGGATCCWWPPAARRSSSTRAAWTD